LQARPDAVNFPRRNRIISGLTRGTLVAEAFESGGALITARLAFEQDREVFAAPGSIFDDHAKGCHQLVQSGQARLVHSVEDLLEELGVHQVPSEPTNKAANRSGLMDLNAVERTLYDVLTEVPMQIDAICDKAELDVSSALVYLLSLEFKGLVCQMAGKHFYRAR
jgi:DNA processing protein